MIMSKNEYLFYEWIILGKGITKEEFQKLTVEQTKELEKEYKQFLLELR